jgi:hypothetical protein
VEIEHFRGLVMVVMIFWFWVDARIDWIQCSNIMKLIYLERTDCKSLYCLVC